MLSAIGTSGLVSRPEFMAALRSMTSKAARMHTDAPRLKGPGSVTNPARKTPAQVSFSRHASSLVCCSREERLAPVSVRVRISGSPPMHASSDSERADRSEWEWCSKTGASLPSSAGGGGGSGVGELTGVATLTAVGLSVGVSAVVSLSVGTIGGVSVGTGVFAGSAGVAAILAGTGVSVASGVDVSPAQAIALIRRTRNAAVARRNCFGIGGGPSFAMIYPPFYRLLPSVPPADRHRPEGGTCNSRYLNLVFPVPPGLGYSLQRARYRPLTLIDSSRSFVVPDRVPLPHASVPETSLPSWTQNCWSKVPGLPISQYRWSLVRRVGLIASNPAAPSPREISSILR